MYQPEHYYDQPQSFHHLTPNSRIIPAPTDKPYHIDSNNDQRKHPLRTSSLQPNSQQHYGRESLVDPTADSYYQYYEQHQGYSRETYIEPETSTMVMEINEDYYLNNTNSHQSYHPVNSMTYFPGGNQYEPPEIRSVNPPKSVKSNVYHVVEEEEQTQPPRAQYQPNTVFNLQPVPSTKKQPNTLNSVSPAPTATKSSNTSKLPKPPLTPLVIPPTPVRSTYSPNQQSFMTPTRTSSIQNSTPASATTPGSYKSLNSPSSHLSPYTPSPCTPSPNTLLPHNMLPSPLGNNGGSKSYKKQSFLPESQAEKYVHEGIKYHEAGKLVEATDMFRQASMIDFPMGMFLYGVSLRHGWGCTKNEHLAFQYLQKSAEHAVVDLNTANAVNTSAAKGELIMAIYELGVSFRHGWGCKKSKETAVHYFKIAADLNDPDAQNDLGHCYFNGHGVKKDMFLAAKYYRKADKQGHGIMGNSWIWKSKYDK